MVKTLPSNAGSMGLIHGPVTKIPHAMLCGQKKSRPKTNKKIKIYSNFNVIIFNGSFNRYNSTEDSISGITKTHEGFGT